MSKDQGFNSGVGMFGYFDAEEKALGIVFSAEQWLREQDESCFGPDIYVYMGRARLLVKGQDHAPMIMMGASPRPL